MELVKIGVLTVVPCEGMFLSRKLELDELEETIKELGN